MSKISSTDKVVTQAQLKEDLQNFYEQIRPFLNGEPGMNLDSTPTQNSTNGATSGGIYTALSGKQNTLTPGTGVSISGNTISAPVSYSTSEHVVGTWIDGKPLYEKTYTGNVPSGISDSTYTDVTFDSNFKQKRLINASGYLAWNFEGTYGRCVIGYDTSLPPTYNSVSITEETSGRGLILSVAGKHFSSQAYVITVQYTKTTD